MDMTTKLVKHQPVIVPTEPPYWMMKPFNQNERKEVVQVYVFSRRVHEGRLRKDGVTPEFYHQIELCYTVLVEWGVIDLQIIKDINLHDTRELEDKGKHPQVTRKMLRAMFDEETDLNNHALTRKMHGSRKKEPIIHFLSRIVKRGWRTLLVKLADRKHSLETLEHLPQEKWQSTYDESRRHYQPLIKELERQLPDDLKHVAARVEKSFEQALRHAHRLVQQLP
jgi:(p)ppGpp synthase/HD superfamily hydrolase